MSADEDQLTRIEDDLLTDTFADFERSVLQDNIVLFDTKAAAVLAFSGVMVLYCVDSIAKFRSEMQSFPWITGPAILALLSLATLGFLVAAMFSLSTVRPRVVRSAKDHVFWDAAVYRLPVNDYLVRMRALNPAVVQEDKLRHLHLLAGICRDKVRNFRTSLYVAEAAFVVLVAAEVARLVR